MQRSYVWDSAVVINIDLPNEAEEVIPGVQWGSVIAFPSPAYWKYQVLARRIQGNPIRNRLGNSLAEEIGACLLGGHGIPAAIGISAFEHLRKKGAFNLETADNATLFEWLSEPIQHGEKSVRYRFAKQKAKYLSAALDKLKSETPPSNSGKSLRNWLVQIPGIGYKTASWVARNWLDADDVAILDIHVLRAGQLGKFFSPKLTVERHYLELEKQFIMFSKGLNVKPSELDAVIWHEMMSSPLLLRQIMRSLETSETKMYSIRTPRTNQRNPNTYEKSTIN